MFCTTCWTEDEAVDQRAIRLWPNTVKVIKHWQDLCKSKRPKNKSYETLVGHHLDIVRCCFTRCCFSAQRFFAVISNQQVPFLEHGFVDVLHTLLKMVIKPDVLDQANSSLKLSKLDLSNSENLLPCELMKFPTATKSSLRTADLSN